MNSANFAFGGFFVCPRHPRSPQDPRNSPGLNAVVKLREKKTHPWNRNIKTFGQVNSADPADFVDVTDVQKILQIQNPQNSFDIR